MGVPVTRARDRGRRDRDGRARHRTRRAVPLACAAALAVGLTACTPVAHVPMPRPPADTPGSGFCEEFPALPDARPTAENTGVPEGTRLRKSDSLVLDIPGEVVDAMDITGGIVVAADDVTIQNSRITVTDWYGITYEDGVTGTKILHNEIRTDDGGYVAIAAQDAVVCGNHIHGFENAVTMGGGTVVQANFMEAFQGLPDEDDPHFDGIELYYGSDSNVWGNNIVLTDPDGNWLEDTGAINITAHWSDIENVEIRGNWLGGGSYTLYATAVDSNALDDIRIVDNRFYGTPPGGHAAWGPITTDDGDKGISLLQGNVWDDTGAPL